MEQVRTHVLVLCRNGKADLHPVRIGVGKVNTLGFNLLDDMFYIMLAVGIEFRCRRCLGFG